MPVSRLTKPVNSCHQSRCYAGPKGSRPPLRGPPRAPKVLSRPKADRYSIDKLSAKDFEQAIRATNGEVGSLSPEEYYEYAKKFADATHRGPFSVSLTANDIPAEAAHETACLLRIGSSSKAHQQLATALWVSASEVNYNPSTISLAKELLHQGAWGKSQDLREVENRFMKLVAQGKDCNALTTYGESLYNSGKYSMAVEMLKQAVNASDGVFEWRRTCLVSLAKSYAKLGKPDEARDTLKTLNDLDADAELDQLLGASGVEQARQEMYTAAIMGKRDVYRQLAELEFEREANETDKGLKENYRLWGMEWSRLADPSVKF
ncbi:hypothetical protein FHETE_4373 [Fusarium heterosporum]|uniref:Uncharacterized protein n=1 Tax=Fusarium heterosporum TaxID=42747 RepID=A0A8H5TEK3_FUSHE|nr:hypothetical protein FHETE_4373 [Fusarium heterosporum]